MTNDQYDFPAEGTDGDTVNVALIKRAAKRSEMLVKEEEADIKEVLSLPAGRRFVFRLLDRARVFSGIYAESPDGQCNVHKTLHREGARNLGLWQVKRIQSASPGLVMKLINEGLEREAQTQRETIRTKKGGTPEEASDVR
jgi:hypothetical protein